MGDFFATRPAVKTRLLPTIKGIKGVEGRFAWHEPAGLPFASALL